MDNCPYSNEIESLHDGELADPRRAEVEKHLVTCAACREQLADLQNLRKALTSMPMGRLSQIGRHRIHARIDQAMESGVIRTAWMLSGLAASILVVGSLWLTQTQDVTQTAPPWVEVSMVTTGLNREVATPAAEWYLAGAFNRADESP
jgi:anti-sigma factor RsiW